MSRQMSNSYKLEWRHKNIESARYSAREWAKRNAKSASIKRTAHRMRIKRFLSGYKLYMGCIDCGYRKHHAGLEFDHVYGTKPRYLAMSNTFQCALVEIDKCEVRCANCHAIRHYNERNGL